ncbi:hypothetical protein [Nostoc sp.]|uniref:hypothetical protein n=1 Tax=Nostoc sp. TaxID=1180 RepID=UPI002FF4BD38
MALRKAETLVDAALSNPATLGDAARTFSAENQDCGVEPKDRLVRVASPREGTFSAAPVAQNEKPSISVIANQTQEEVEQGNSASLLGESQVSGVEVKADQESESSAPPVSQTEKWSHEAIVARSNVRPGRMQKLTRCSEFRAIIILLADRNSNSDDCRAALVIFGRAETGSEESDNQWMITGKSSTRSEVVLFNCFIAASLIRECLSRISHHTS